MATPDEIVVVGTPVEDFDGEKLSLINVNMRTWKYKNDEGELCTKSQPEADLMYGTKQRACIQLNDVRTITGVQFSSKTKSLFMSLSLDPEVSQAIRSKVDDFIKELVVF